MPLVMKNTDFKVKSVVEIWHEGFEPCFDIRNKYTNGDEYFQHLVMITVATPFIDT